MERLVVLDGIAYHADAKVRGNAGATDESNVVELTFFGNVPHFSHKDSFSVVEILADEWRLQYRNADVIYTSIDMEENIPVEQTIELLAQKYEYI